MAAAAIQVSVPGRPALLRRATEPWAWALLATAFLVAVTLAAPGPSPGDWLGDTDDAVRLVGVRELIAGSPWLDTTLARLGAPEPLLSHWSRLIDLPLALLIRALTPMLGQDGAELATRIVWPLLLFFVLALVVAREAGQRGGRAAGAFAIFLAATSAMALAQFRPGRIDHHNAMILCTVAGLLLLARSTQNRRTAWGAGALLGLGLAIGYEAIAIMIPALALASLLALLRQPGTEQNASGAQHATAAATLVLAVAFAATIPPWRWLDVRCDALSLNLVALAACTTAGLYAAERFGGGRLARCTVAGAGAMLGAGIYAWLEPACLAGPFGQVAPALKPIWLDQVMETRSILWLGAAHPATALSIAVFMAAGSAAQIALWRRQRDAGNGLLAAFVTLAAVPGCWQIKFLPYACWLAAVPVAVWVAGLSGTRLISATVVRAATLVLLSQSTLGVALGAAIAPLLPSGTQGASEVEASDPRRPCFLSHNVRRLAGLPAGLVAADIDLGPYIVALTPHRVVAAPYHRLQAGILANQAIMTAEPEEAYLRLAALGVDYVALCTDRWQKSPAARRASGPRSLRARLLNGGQVEFLREMPQPAAAPVRIWRVQPGG
jgi:hypothetical protein